MASKKTIDEEKLLKDIAQKVMKLSILKNADHTLIHTEDGHYKFYQLQLMPEDNPNEGVVNICYGKIGSGGNFSTKTFSNQFRAANFLQQTLAEKLKKGYVEPLSSDALTTPSAKRISRKKMTPEGLEKLDAFMSMLK